MCTSIGLQLFCVPSVPSKAVYSFFLNALLECFLNALLECFDHSGSLLGSCVPGGLALTGSWWERSGEMRTGTILARGQIDWWPENLFRGCCPCISLTLKFFLSTLACRTWLCLQCFSQKMYGVRECESVRERERERERVQHMYWICFFCVCLEKCLCVCRHVWWLEREERAYLFAILALTNSRSSFHALPTFGQSVSDQSGA